VVALFSSFRPFFSHLTLHLTHIIMSMDDPLTHLPLDHLQTPIPSTLQQQVDAAQTQPQNQPSSTDGKPRRTRSKWTQAETNDLIKGCGIHGVGNWKK
jgi:hypothetical protein